MAFEHEHGESNSMKNPLQPSDLPIHEHLTTIEDIPLIGGSICEDCCKKNQSKNLQLFSNIEKQSSHDCKRKNDHKLAQQKIEQIDNVCQVENIFNEGGNQLDTMCQKCDVLDQQQMNCDNLVQERPICHGVISTSKIDIKGLNLHEDASLTNQTAIVREVQKHSQKTDDKEKEQVPKGDLNAFMHNQGLDFGKGYSNGDERVEKNLNSKIWVENPQKCARPFVSTNSLEKRKRSWIVGKNTLAKTTPSKKVERARFNAMMDEKYLNEYPNVKGVKVENMTLKETSNPQVSKESEQVTIELANASNSQGCPSNNLTLEVLRMNLKRSHNTNTPLEQQEGRDLRETLDLIKSNNEEVEIAPCIVGGLLKRRHITNKRVASVCQSKEDKMHMNSNSFPRQNVGAINISSTNASCNMNDNPLYGLRNDNAPFGGEVQETSKQVPNEMCNLYGVLFKPISSSSKNVVEHKDPLLFNEQDHEASKTCHKKTSNILPLLAKEKTSRSNSNDHLHNCKMTCDTRCKFAMPSYQEQIWDFQTQEDTSPNSKNIIEYRNHKLVEGVIHSSSNREQNRIPNHQCNKEVEKNQKTFKYKPKWVTNLKIVKTQENFKTYKVGTKVTNGPINQNLDGILLWPTTSLNQIIKSHVKIILQIMTFLLALLISMLSYVGNVIRWTFTTSVFSIQTITRRLRKILRIVNITTWFCKERPIIVNPFMVHGGGRFTTWIYVVFMFDILFVHNLFDLDLFVAKHFIEQQLIIRETLHFDYTKINPIAIVPLLPPHIMTKAKEFSFSFFDNEVIATRAFPATHKLHVVIFLNVPESEYNQEIGMFQVLTLEPK
jgi:hypothetical protein